MSVESLAVVDDDGTEVVLDRDEARSLLSMTGDFEGATVSACPTCRSRVLACVAVVDVLDAAPPHPRAGELHELAEDAPTLHVYVQDLETSCTHERWLDPGRAEWDEAIEDLEDEPRGIA